MSDTPETDALDQEPHNHRLLQNRYIEIRTHAQNMERERNQLKSIVEQRLVAGATIHQNANDLMRKNERLESERDELIGVIKSLRKNAKEEADRIEWAKLLVKQLVLLIEHPPYSVDEAIGKMILMDDAKKFINEMS